MLRGPGLLVSNTPSSSTRANLFTPSRTVGTPSGMTVPGYTSRSSSTPSPSPSVTAGSSTTSVSEAGSASVRPLAVRSLVTLRKLPTGADDGTWRSTVKLHDPAGSRLPPLRLMKAFSAPDSSSEPEPQASAAGRPIAVTPGNMADRSSRNLSPWTPCVGSRFRIVNVSGTVSPACTGPANVLVNTIASISSTSLAGGPSTGMPAIAPVTGLVVLSASPPKGALAGSWSTTSKVHDWLPASVPPVRVSRLVPEIAEPGPQTSVWVPLMLARPLSTASRSSVKPIPTAGPRSLRLATSKRSVTVPPGLAGSSMNSLLSDSRLLCTARSSEALSKKTLTPPNSPENPVVTLLYSPSGVPAGSCSVTSKVHEVSAARLPPCNSRKAVPPSEEPGPQTSAAGSPVATRPETTSSRSSKNRMPVASSTGLMLSMVKRNITVPPGSAGSSTNDLSSVRPATRRSATAALPTTGSPATVEITLDVVLVCVPGAAVAGTWSVTANVQVSPGTRLPPVSDSRLVPLIWEPVPHTSSSGVSTATRPPSAESRSSVNSMPIASATANSLWLTVNSRVAGSPGATGSSMNSFESSGPPITSRVAVAGLPMTFSPSTRPVTTLVVLA